MEESLKNRVVKGTFWVFTSQIATQIFSLAKNVIIARALSPEDFGLFGIAIIALSLLETSSQTGFDAALIQKKENIKEYLDTAFVVNIIRGVILFVLLFFLAPLVSIFFKNEAVIPIIRVISFTFLINGFINPGTIYFRKELDFKRQFYWDASKTITDVVVVLSIVFLLRNVWVLVIAIISSNLVRMIVSYLIHSFRPRFHFKKEYALNLFKFGKWVLASNILVYLITQGDNAFVGKILGVTMLGFYKMAYLFSNLPATHITNVIARVSYPAFSKLQDDIRKLREAYIKVLEVTAFFALPIAGLIFILAPDFTRLFLGEKWMPMVRAMQVLVWWGVIRSLVGSMSPVFLAVGKPKILAQLQFYQTILLFTLIYPLSINYSITGTSFAVLSSGLLMWFIRNQIFLKIINCRTWLFYKNILYPMLISAISVSSVIFTKKFIFKTVEIYTFFLLVLVFLVIFSILSIIGYKFGILKLKPILKDLREASWKK